jgi:Ser/Thr protein kinase RdoA (MazF antagonist)
VSFENLTPDTILDAVERASGFRLTPLTIPLPSYINRVYELRAVDGTKLIVKFYRPGRWSRESILAEHGFENDCQEAEIPVVPPLRLGNGTTIAEHDGGFFALFPKRAGRQLEITSESDWPRIGSLLGRLHLAGSKRKASARITIDPRLSTMRDIDLLCTAIIPEPYRGQYRTTAMRLIEMSAPLWEELEIIRIHGDCHRGNILDRLDEGLLVIDFDDMAMGPPVQDLWLLLPDRAANARYEIDLFLQGYERFRRFDRASLRCIEPLRAMRMIYFLAWCSRQIEDFQFRKNFPDWGNERFWQREINDLREQLGFVMETIGNGGNSDDEGNGHEDGWSR